LSAVPDANARSESAKEAATVAETDIKVKQALKCSVVSGGLALLSIIIAFVLMIIFAVENTGLL
jgi:hypothetical protein